MRQSQEANDRAIIEQEQADQVRRTVGATLAARALEGVLPAIAKGYGPNMHRKAAAKMSENMHKPKHTPGPWTTNGHSVGVAMGSVCTMYRPGDQTGRGLTQSEQEANARLIAASPDLFDVSANLHMNVNSLHATMRATSAEYRGSALCRAMDALIRKNAAALSAARGEGRGA